MRFGLVIGGLFLLFAGDGENAVIKLDVDIFRGNAGKFDLHDVILLIAGKVDVRQEVSHLVGSNGLIFRTAHETAEDAVNIVMKLGNASVSGVHAMETNREGSIIKEERHTNMPPYK